MIKHGALSQLTQASKAMAWAAFFLMIGSASAMADAETVGQLISNTEGQFASTSFMSLLAIISYIIATVLGTQAMAGAIRYASNDNNTKLVGLTYRTLGSAAFFNLPRAVGILRDTLYNSANPGGAIGTKYGAASGGSGGLDTSLVSMVQDLSPSLSTAVGTVAFLSGLFMIGSGLIGMSNYQYVNDNVNKKQILARLGVGTALTAFSSSVNSILATLFGTSTMTSSAALSYDHSALDSASNAQIDGVLNAIYIWLALVGMMAIVRGLWNLKELMEKGGGLTGPLTHLIAGGMLVNMGPTVHLIEKNARRAGHLIGQFARFIY